MTIDISKCKVIYQPRGRAQEYSPLALNLYTGCHHGCNYCYVPRCLRKDKTEFHSKVTVRKNIIENLRHDVEILATQASLNASPRQAENTDDKSSIVNRQSPILLCFTCDPYTPEVLDDPYNQTTSKVIKILTEAGLNFQVLTKAGLRAVKDFHLYQPGDKFAVTLTYFNPEKSLEIEPSATLPAERIESLKLAKKKGIETWVSFEPALNEMDIHNLLEASAPYTDFYKIGKVTEYQSEITDWPSFVERITKHLNWLKKPFMLKRDLKNLTTD